MGHTASYYYKGTIPNAMYFTTIPFGMIAPEMYAWFYHDDGMELMQAATTAARQRFRHGYQHAHACALRHLAIPRLQPRDELVPDRAARQSLGDQVHRVGHWSGGAAAE